ncbi:MAG: repeat protein [Pedosphaera sp.]|nr:repeat protein [Pedosphaera sp.]
MTASRQKSSKMPEAINSSGGHISIVVFDWWVKANKGMMPRVRTRKTIAIILLATLTLAVLYRLTPSPPRYQGRSLSFWLKALDDGKRGGGLTWETWQDRTEEQPGRSEAAEAIMQMGTNSLPFLITALSYRDSTVKKWFVGLLGLQSWIKVSLPMAADHQRPAALALHILGPAAKPALPQLTKALNDPETSQGAAIALAGIGPEGWSVLSQALASTNQYVSVCAAWALGGHRAEVPGTVAGLMRQVTNATPSGLGPLSAWALGAIGQNKEQVVPLLINGLQSSQVGVRWGSAIGLGEFGTNAQSAVPALLRSALQDSDKTVRMYATTALKQIDPTAAAKAGVK